MRDFTVIPVFVLLFCSLPCEAQEIRELPPMQSAWQPPEATSLRSLKNAATSKQTNALPEFSAEYSKHFNDAKKRFSKVPAVTQSGQRTGQAIDLIAPAQQSQTAGGLQDAPGEIDDFLKDIQKQTGNDAQTTPEKEYYPRPVAPPAKAAKSNWSSEPSKPWPVAGSQSKSPKIPATKPTSQPATSVLQADDSLTWWREKVASPLDASLPGETIDSNILVYRALQRSPRIQAISQEPLIRELQVVEADSEFDAIGFVQSQFEDRNDPVGNTLTVGNGESFLRDNIWSADLGLRRRARNGAQWELNQTLGFQNSNSNFFSPQDQGTATLALNVTQPLLRGRGQYVNQAQILIAQAAGGAAWETFDGELQDELLAVINAYWQLYFDRSAYLQRNRNVERGQEVLNRLEGRSELDSLPNQLSRARSSVQTRKTELANSRRDVRNSETEIRRLIADTRWIGGDVTELLPAELPYPDAIQLPLDQIVSNALNHRPEIREVMSRARIATLQQNVNSNELLPELSLLLGTYVSALRGDTGIENAFQDQFGQVRPGYNVGINFEMPYGNRAARSRLTQSRLRVSQIRAELDQVTQAVIAESQIAQRRVVSAGETLVAAEAAIRAARADMEQFNERWEAFALVEGDVSEGQSPTTILDQLLESHDRLAASELVYVQAEMELKVSEFALQRAMGTLLIRQNISKGQTISGHTPRVELFKDGGPVSNSDFQTFDSQQTFEGQIETTFVDDGQIYDASSQTTFVEGQTFEVPVKSTLEAPQSFESPQTFKAPESFELPRATQEPKRFDALETFVSPYDSADSYRSPKTFEVPQTTQTPAATEEFITPFASAKKYESPKSFEPAKSPQGLIAAFEPPQSAPPLQAPVSQTEFSRAGSSQNVPTAKRPRSIWASPAFAPPGTRVAEPGNSEPTQIR